MQPANVFSPADVKTMIFDEFWHAIGYPCLCILCRWSLPLLRVFLLHRAISRSGARLHSLFEFDWLYLYVFVFCFFFVCVRACNFLQFFQTLSGRFNWCNVLAWARSIASVFLVLQWRKATSSCLLYSAFCLSQLNFPTPYVVTCISAKRSSKCTTPRMIPVTSSGVVAEVAATCSRKYPQAQPDPRFIQGIVAQSDVLDTSREDA